MTWFIARVTLLRQKLAFAVEFRSRVDALLVEGNRDTYEWLTLHATRMLWRWLLWVL